MRKALVFVTDDNGCMVCLNLSPNDKGYLEYRWGAYGSEGREKLHRFVYRAHHGEIPPGHDIHHQCHNRRCCNPEHLEALAHSEHATLTNNERWALAA